MELTESQSLLIAACEDLRILDEELKSHQISAFEHSRLREDALITALHMTADICGVTLKPTHINALGDFTISAVDPDPAKRMFCGRYGEQFAALLSTVSWRTGVVADKGKMLPENGWCYVNHFEVERMVTQFAAQVSEQFKNAHGESMLNDQSQGRLDRPRG